MRQPHWPLSADRSDLGVGDTARGSAGDSTPTWLLQIGGLRPPTPLWAQRKRSSFLQPTASCAAFVGVRASWNRTEAAGPLPHAALRGTHKTYVLSPGQAAWCSGVPVVSGSASKLVAQMSDRSTRCHLRVLSQRPGKYLRTVDEADIQKRSPESCESENLFQTVVFMTFVSTF